MGRTWLAGINVSIPKAKQLLGHRQWLGCVRAIVYLHIGLDRMHRVVCALDTCVGADDGHTASLTHTSDQLVEDICWIILKANLHTHTHTHTLLKTRIGVRRAIQPTTVILDRRQTLLHSGMPHAFIFRVQELETKQQLPESGTMHV